MTKATSPTPHIHKDLPRTGSPVGHIPKHQLKASPKPSPSPTLLAAQLGAQLASLATNTKQNGHADPTQHQKQPNKLPLAHPPQKQSNGAHSNGARNTAPPKAAANGSATLAGNTSTSTASTPASSSTATGPSRFRGDVPAFNPSGLPLYTHMPYPPPPAAGYPPQYYAQQPLVYGNQMMPYYPFMAYPNYMYQQYPYFVQNQYPQNYGNVNSYQNRKKFLKYNHLYDRHDLRKDDYDDNRLNVPDGYKASDSGHHHHYNPQPPHFKTHAPVAPAVPAPKPPVATAHSSQPSRTATPATTASPAVTETPTPPPTASSSSATPSSSAVVTEPETETKAETPAEADPTLAPLFFGLTLEELSLAKKSRKLIVHGPDALQDFSTSANTYRIIDYDTNTEYHSLPAQNFGSPTPPQEETTELTKPVALNWALLLQPTAQTPKSRLDASAGTDKAKLSGSALLSGPQPLGQLAMSMLYNPAYTFQSFEIKPRGLTNSGNICYMNAVLQCLIFCEPFSGMLKAIKDNAIGHLGPESPSALLDAMISFIEEFTASKATNNGSVGGRLLSPENLFSRLVESPKFSHLKWGQQEDAEEFLVYLLDGLHEEFVKAESTITAETMELLCGAFVQGLDARHAAEIKAQMKRAYKGLRTTGNKPVEETEETSEEDDGWLEVGSKRKVSKKRVLEVEPSPINKIFGGLFRSVLTVAKAKEALSITVDPYRCISLDIPEGDLIEDALRLFSQVETLSYTNEGQDVTATKQTFIEELPNVLILQLKRFSFLHQNHERAHMGTIEKVLKNIEFGPDLTVPAECLLPASRAGNRLYSLRGVIYHHGRNAEGGHYTCDVLDGQQWLRIDDTAVELIDAASVTQTPDAEDKSAYILMYQRV